MVGAPTGQPVAAPFNPLHPIVDAALSVAHLVSLPKELVQGGLGEGLAATITGPTRSIQPPERIAQVENARKRGLAGAAMFSDLITNTPVIDNGVGRFAADLVTDPLTYAGFGIPTRLSTAVKASAFLTGRPAVQARVLQGLTALESADTFVATAPWAATKATAVAAGKTVGRLPAIPGMMVTTPAGGQRAASSLADYLSSPSATSLYKQKVTEFTDMASTLLGKGHKLERDVAEMDLLQPLPVPTRPGTSFFSTIEANNVIGKLQSDFLGEIKSLSNPTAKAYAMNVLYEVEKSVELAQRQAAARQLDITARLGSAPRAGSPAYNAITEGYQRAFEQASGAIQSGRVLLRRYATDAPRVDPAVASSIISETKKVTDLVDTMGILTGGYRTGTGAAPGWMLSDIATQQIARAVQDFRTALGHAMPHGFDVVPGDFANVLTQRDAVARGLPGIAGVLPDSMQDTAKVLWPALQPKLNNILSARDVVANTARDVWDFHNPSLPFPTSGLFDLNALNTVMTRIPGGSRVNASVDLLKQDAFLQALSPDKITRLRSTLERFPGGDVFTTDPYRLAVDSLARDYARQYGIGTNKLINFIQGATGLYKVQALETISYTLTNVIGALTAGKLEGVPVGRTINNLFDNFVDMWQGRAVMTAEARNLEMLTGQRIPNEVTQASGILADVNPTREFFNKGAGVAQKIGAKTLGGAGALGGAISGAVQDASDPGERAKHIIGGAATGAAIGGTLPMVEKYWLQRIAGGVEAVLRQDAYTMAFTRDVADRTDRLLAAVDSAAAQKVRVALQTSPGVRTPQSVGLSDSAISALHDTIENAGGLISPEEVAAIMRRNGVDAGSAANVANYWRNELAGAAQVGADFSNGIHVNYEKLSNLEQFMKEAFPFSTWALKMTPFFVRHTLENPIIVSGILALNQASRDEMNAKGLPGRFAGSISVPIGDAVFSSLIGRPVQVWFNPLRGIAPFADTAKMTGQALDEENPVAAGYRFASSFGIAPHPAVETALRMAGVFGTDEPARGYVRLGQIGKALTGADVNAGFTQAESGLRRLMTGQSPTNLDEVSIQKRLDELAVQQLGGPARPETPGSGPFIAARVNKSGPLWDQAARDVMNEQAIRAATGFISQGFTPQAILSPEEARIRQARKTTDQGGQRVAVDPAIRKTLEDAMKAGQTDAPVDQSIRDAVYTAAVNVFGPTLPDPLPMYFKVGNVATINAALSAVTAAQSGGVVKGSGGATVTNVSPLIAAYSGGSSPEETQLNNLLSLYNSPGSITPGNPNAEAVNRLFMLYQQAPDFLKKGITSHPLLADALQARTAYRKANPLLDGYLNYLAGVPNGNKQDFLTNTYAKR
jgi:hypothetical protein